MLLIIVIFVQWNVDNPEAKYFCSRPFFATERAESLHSFDVLKYEIDARLPMTNRSLQAVNQIKCRSNINGLIAVTLHRNTITIDSVRVNGVNATYTMANDTMHINLPQTFNLGDSFFIYIRYHGSWSVTSSQSGFCYYPKNYNSSTLHANAYTMSEPWDARRWLPCYDQPYDKADQGCIIKVTAPDSFVACANGALVSVVNNPGGTRTWTYQEDYAIATYLMHFGVSRFARWSQWFHGAAGDSVEIRNFMWPQDSAQSLIAFQHLPDAMQLFDSIYGVYPFDRYGQDAVYPFAAGGMEHQEQTTIHRNWILNSSENGMAHELSHMWWGDRVTCVDFRDIWLNEGFATYSDANYNWYRFGHDNFISTMQTRAQDYFDDDAASRHPLYNPPQNELFSWGYSYCKGSWVCHMLRYLNQGQFFNAIAAYGDSFAYSCARTDDLKNIFNQVYGVDLTWFFNEWVYDQGYPVYNVHWVCNPSGLNYLVKINVYQVQTNAPPVFHMPVEILLHMASKDTLVSFPITASPTHAEFTVSQNVSAIAFDPDTWILCTHNIYVGTGELVSNGFDNGISLPSNPIAGDCRIFCMLGQSGNVKLRLYDETGRLANEISLGMKLPGRYQVNIPDLAAGVYFVQMILEPQGAAVCVEKMKKLVLVR